MIDERWPQADKLFQIAVEIEPARRAAFLDKECAGNHILKKEVESLLNADSFDWDFIETPAIQSAAVLFADEEPRLTRGEHLGQYEIIDLIGKGGMGEVYLAEDQILNRKVALKLLPFDFTQDKDRLLRLRREARTASALNHPNILTIYELGDVDGQQFIATELIEGETLRERITRDRLSMTDALEIAIQAARALSAAHRAGVVHRDIKPDNIMLRPDGHVKVLDFGLAKLAAESELARHVDGHHSVDISSRLLMGTPRYMSPEQIAGKSVDARSDIYSLGAVLYEMLAGHPPFDDKDRFKLAESILKDDPPPLDAPEKLKAVVERALDKNRESRYQSVAEILTDLNLIKHELAFEAAGLTRLRFNRVAVMIALLCAVAIGVGTFVFYKSSANDQYSSSANELGTWAAKAPISSLREDAEPAVLNGVLYVVGGWNTCTPFADLEAYDSVNDVWTSRAPMLTARGGHGVAVLDGLLYVVGGAIDCSKPTSGVEAYDPRGNTWTARASLPEPRSNHMVASADGKLYAIGGQTAGGEFVALNTQYDPESDTWSEMTPMPTARAGAAAAVVHGIVYVIGGQDKLRQLATVEAYDPTTNSWTARRPMQQPRHELAVSELNGIIYAFGGKGDRTNIEAYDPASDTWTVVGEMPARRYSVHATALDDSIYLAGGHDGFNYFSNVLAFKPLSRMESKAEKCPVLRKLPLSSMPTARQGTAVGAVNGIVYVIGGSAGTKFLSTNEAYDPTSNAWATKAEMPTRRETAASNYAVVGKKIYVIGGNASGYCTDLNEEYDPKTNTWSTKAPMPTPRCHCAVVAHQGLIYAIGGTDTTGSIRYSNVEVYNPISNEWSTVAPMPTARYLLGAVSLNNTIYAVGGSNPALSFDALTVVEAYDTTTGAWETKAPLLTARRSMAAGALKGRLVVIGGQRNDETILATVEAYEPTRDSWVMLSSLAAARTFSSAVTVGDTLYVFGGHSPHDPVSKLTTAEAFNLPACSD